MATCRECLHQVLCDTYSRMGVTDVPADDVTICELFNPKSDYVKRERGEWISVNDRLPDEEGKYLVFIVDEISSFIDIRHFYKTNNKFGIVSWYVEELGRKVTHWQPLPEPPKGK